MGIANGGTPLHFPKREPKASTYKSTTETQSSQRRTASFFEKKRLISVNKWKRAK